jgi:periplasmic protein TonB
LASAADMGPETVSPPASASGTATETNSLPASTPDTPTQTPLPSASESVAAPEEFPMEPAEPGPEETTTKIPLKANMVAHEVRIKATGARPGNGVGERELFTEETTTVLVFEKGGVIRLSAAVTPGQLLFLANVESKREVVAQVSRKRTYKPTSCYVEVEFTEPAPRFWGMEFSAATALLPKGKEEIEAAALVISAETTVDVPGEPVSAPTAQEVETLKREVEALRVRPAATASTLPAEPSLMQTNEPAPTSSSTPAPAPGTISDSPVAPIMVEVPQVETQWSAGSEAEPSGAFASKSLPIEHHHTPVQLTAAEQELLPTPSLDFSKSLPKRKRSLRARGNFTPSFRAGALRLVLLTMALVVTMVGAAWYKHWIPWMPGAKKSSVNAISKPGNAKTATLPGGQTTAGTDGENGSTKLMSDLPVTSPNAAAKNAASTSSPDKPATDGADNASQPSASTDPVVQPEIPEKPAPKTPAVKRTSARPTAKAAADAAATPADDGVIVPPKLIKSVRAVASLEDLRDFERGNVTIDAVVDTQGEVRSINVLSGPPSLREPAAAAFRQFQYEPATRNGKPVPAHVTVTIHFRFEP